MKMDIEKLDSEFLYVVTTDFNDSGKKQWKEYCDMLCNAGSIEDLETRVCEIASAHEECATQKHNESLYAEINAKLRGWLQPGEKIFFYCSVGLISKSKEGYAVTNLGIIIFNKKATYVIPYRELKTMMKTFAGSHWIVNGDTKTMLQAIGITPIEFSSVLALITMYAYTNRQGNNKLIISKQTVTVY